jgi:hypothetical protein
MKNSFLGGRDRALKNKKKLSFSPILKNYPSFSPHPKKLS